MSLVRKILLPAALFFLPERVFSQPALSVDWTAVESLLNEQNDSVTVLNFWATWCRPCVAEIPAFLEVKREMAGKPVRFIFISLDFEDEKSGRLDPFILRKMPGARVWLLKDTDYNHWVGKVDPSWSGSLPATLVIGKKGRKTFAQAEINKEKLRSMISNSFLNSKP